MVFFENFRKSVINFSEETNAEDLTEEKETMQNASESMQKVDTNSETTQNHDLNNNQDYTEEVTEIESEWDEWEDSPTESSDEPWKKLSKKERKKQKKELQKKTKQKQTITKPKGSRVNLQMMRSTTGRQLVKVEEAPRGSSGIKEVDLGEGKNIQIDLGGGVV